MEVKDFSTKLNCKKSLKLIQYLEDDILNNSSTVMFRGTPISESFCRFLEFLSQKTLTVLKTDLKKLENLPERCLSFLGLELDLVGRVLISQTPRTE